MAFFLPETKGLLIEDVHEVFASHWFWKRTGVVTHSKVTPLNSCTCDDVRQQNANVGLLVTCLTLSCCCWPLN